MRRLTITIVFALFLLISLLGLLAEAHRSGCHRWHSCPSDRGTYVCGDLGYCSQCPDNQYCQNGRPRPTKQEKEEPKERICVKEEMTGRIVCGEPVQ